MRVLESGIAQLRRRPEPVGRDGDRRDEEGAVSLAPAPGRRRRRRRRRRSGRGRAFPSPRSSAGEEDAPGRVLGVELPEKRLVSEPEPARNLPGLGRRHQSEARRGGAGQVLPFGEERGSRGGARARARGCGRQGLLQRHRLVGDGSFFSLLPGGGHSGEHRDARGRVLRLAVRLQPGDEQLRDAVALDRRVVAAAVGADGGRLPAEELDLQLSGGLDAEGGRRRGGGGTGRRRGGGRGRARGASLLRLGLGLFRSLLLPPRGVAASLRLAAAGLGVAAAQGDPRLAVLVAALRVPAVGPLPRRPRERRRLDGPPLPQKRQPPRERVGLRGFHAEPEAVEAGGLEELVKSPAVRIEREEEKERREK